MTYLQISWAFLALSLALHYVPGFLRQRRERIERENARAIGEISFAEWVEREQQRRIKTGAKP